MDTPDLYRLTKDCESIALQIERMADALAKAKVVERYDSDRRKNLLAEYVAPMLASNSATAAENMARADKGYQGKLHALSQDLNAAMMEIAKESGLQARLEAARSVLAVTRAQMAL